MLYAIAARPGVSEMLFFNICESFQRSNHILSFGVKGANAGGAYGHWAKQATPALSTGSTAGVGDALPRYPARVPRTITSRSLAPGRRYAVISAW